MAAILSDGTPIRDLCQAAQAALETSGTIADAKVATLAEAAACGLGCDAENAMFLCVYNYLDNFPTTLTLPIQ